MSLPPQVIRVKRKRTEEGPVPSFLRIEHNTKRHRGDAFLYQRHDPEAAAAQAAKRAAEEADAASRASRPPTIQPSQPGEERKRKSLRGVAAKIEPEGEGPAATTKEKVNLQPEPAAAQTTSTAPAGLPAVEPRRFHLSRDSLMAAHNIAASVLGVTGASGIRKRTRYGPNGQVVLPISETAVFVERSKRRKREDATRKVRRNVQDEKGGVALHTAGSGGVPKTATAAPAAVVPLPKRPGWKGPGVRRSASGVPTAGTSTPAAAGDEATAAAGADASGTERQTPALPPSLVDRRWDTDMDRLAREMNDYTLEVIGHNLARMEQEQEQQYAKAAAEAKAGELSLWEAERRRAAYAKFKPKPLKPGTAHPASRQASGVPVGAQDAAMADTASHNDQNADADDASETDEEDYVTETYVRVPGHDVPQAQAGGAAALAGSVGLLVFDNEPDMEFFYGAEEDSEEEFEDDEDENAENYYTHDYPEDEVSSDDEFGRDPYHYRTGNASDLEEFVDSDEEGEGNGAEGGKDKGGDLDGAAVRLPTVRLKRTGEL